MADISNLRKRGAKFELIFKDEARNNVGYVDVFIIIRKNSDIHQL
jgi:hypothetical protein